MSRVVYSLRVMSDRTVCAQESRYNVGSKTISFQLLDPANPLPIIEASTLGPKCTVSVTCLKALNPKP